MKILSDPASEKGTLGGICRFGNKVWPEVSKILNTESFTYQPNQIIWKCLESILNREDAVTIDIPSIYAEANSLGLDFLFEKQSYSNHLENIYIFSIEQENILKLAKKIRKLQIARELQQELTQAKEELNEITGNESITDILGIGENKVLNFALNIDKANEIPQLFGKNIQQYIKFLENNQCDQIGLPTPIPEYNFALGGGLRKGCVDLISARRKMGKSNYAIAVGLHLSKLNIKVLALDSEMNIESQRNRLLANLSGIKLEDIENGQFATNKLNKLKVEQAAEQLDKLPYFFYSVAGLSFEEIMHTMKNWILREVGLNKEGTAKQCLICYDYIKLMSKSEINNLQEYQLLGLYCTGLHDFAVRYNIPILLFSQLNRENLVSGSDRLEWLCSSSAFLEDKSDEEVKMDGPDKGSKKLRIITCRHGPGLNRGEYINIKFEGWRSRIRSCGTNYQDKLDIEEIKF